MRFIKDKNQIYFDNAKMGPIYEELHDWKISYEKELYEKKSSLRKGHQVFFMELKELIKRFFSSKKSEVMLSNSFTSAFQKILIIYCKVHDRNRRRKEMLNHVSREL